MYALKFLEWGGLICLPVVQLHMHAQRPFQARLVCLQVYQASPQTMLPVMPHLLAELTAREDARRARPTALRTVQVYLTKGFSRLASRVPAVVAGR